MLEFLFYFIFIISSIFLAWGLKEYSSPIIILAGVLLFGLGALAISEGLQRETNYTITKVSTTPTIYDVNIATTTITTINNPPFYWIAQVLFYGGVLCILIGIANYFKKAKLNTSADGMV